MYLGVMLPSISINMCVYVCIYVSMYVCVHMFMYIYVLIMLSIIIAIYSVARAQIIFNCSTILCKRY